MQPGKASCAALFAFVALSTGGCTLAKPVVCAITTPVYLCANSTGWWFGADGRGALCALGVMAAVGAVGGLVTGIVSDVQVLSGCAPDPCRNWHDPFATNTSAPSFR